MGSITRFWKDSQIWQYITLLHSQIWEYMFGNISQISQLFPVQTLIPDCLTILYCPIKITVITVKRTQLVSTLGGMSSYTFSHWQIWGGACPAHASLQDLILSFLHTFQWWIQGGTAGACPPKGSILSFSHMFSLKSTHIGGWHPTQMAQHPPNRKSWIRHCIFTEKCPRQRSTLPPNGSMPPCGKSWIRHC